MYRSQFSFSATMVKPDACCRSSPVGDTKFPVAKKLDIFAPMSKLTRERTLVNHLSTATVHSERCRLGTWEALTVLEIDNGSGSDFCSDSAPDVVQDLLHLLLEDHGV